MCRLCVAAGGARLKILEQQARICARGQKTGAQNTRPAKRVSKLLNLYMFIENECCAVWVHTYKASSTTTVAVAVAVVSSAAAAVVVASLVVRLGEMERARTWRKP